MFGRHQKATAHWQCSIWPNMEGKNAAFSRNQTGKREKKEGFLACCVHSEIELLHSLRSGHRAGSFPKQHDWWWCRTCRDISANTVGQAHTNTQTPARLRSHERKAHQSFGCGDVSFLNTQKAFFALAYELYTILSNALWIWAPWKGTFLSVKNPPSPTPQFSTSVRNSLFICPQYTEWLWHSPATA